MQPHERGTIAQVGPFRGTMSTLVAIATIYVVMIVALHLTGWHLAYAKWVLEGHSYFYVPRALAPLLGNTGIIGTVTSLFVAGLNAFVITSVVGGISFLVSHLYNRSVRKANAPDHKTPDVMADPVLLKIPTPGCTLTLKDYDGTALPGLIPEAHLWLKRTPMKPAFALNTPLDHLRLALLEVLESHQDWTADPDGHHADTGLKEHSIEVTKRLLKLAPNEPLAVHIGLAHDIGKIFAYRRGKPIEVKKAVVEPGKPPMEQVAQGLQKLKQADPRVLLTAISNDVKKYLDDPEGAPAAVKALKPAVPLPPKADPKKWHWERVTANHDHLSAHILRSIPEFSKLEEGDRRRLIMVLSYMHTPQRMPRNEADDRTRELISMIRIADGLTVQKERAEAAANAGSGRNKEEIIKVLPGVISALNVNQSVNAEARADGWTSPGFSYVAISEEVLRYRVAALLPEDVQMALSVRVRVPQSQTHPATLAILASLGTMGWLIEQHNAIAPTTPLFGFQSGRLAVPRVVLLRRVILAQHYKDLVTAWGRSKFELRIRAPS